MYIILFFIMHKIYSTLRQCLGINNVQENVLLNRLVIILMNRILVSYFIINNNDGFQNITCCTYLYQDKNDE